MAWKPRYRQVIETELGPEIQCGRCKDFWPIDKEFWYFRGDEPHSYCKACYWDWKKERREVKKAALATA